MLKASNSSKDHKILPNGVTIYLDIGAPWLIDKSDHELQNIQSTLRYINNDILNKKEITSFLPNFEYSSDDIISHSKYTKSFAVKMCKQFDDAFTEKKDPTMQDFYDFFWYEYKIKKKLKDYMPSVSSTTNFLLRSSPKGFSLSSINLPDLSISRDHIRNTIALICSLGVSMTPLHSFKSIIDPSVFEVVDFDYTSNISHILNISDGKTSRLYLKTLPKHEDLWKFQARLSSFRKDLGGLLVSWIKDKDLSALRNLLEQYNDLLELIDNVWSNNKELQTIKYSILKLTHQINKKHIKKPKHDNLSINIPLFWRDEEDLWKIKQQENSEPYKPEESTIEL